MLIEDNDIFVPTRGRIHDQTTLQLLPKAVLEHVHIVCHPGEDRTLIAEWGNRVKNITPFKAKNIGEVRQYCIDHLATTDYITFVDDSLNFHIRAESDTGTVTQYSLKEITERHFTPEHIEEYRFRIFRWINNTLHTDEYGMVGVSRRSGNNNILEPTALNSRICSFWGINRRLFRQLPGHPKFSDMPIKEDFYIYLHFLTNGIPTITAYKYAYGRARGSNSTGGCSIYRDIQLSTVMSKRLKDYFPAFVVLNDKSTKSWGGEFRDGTVTDVRIYSKKAYDYGRKMLLQRN